MSECAYTHFLDCPLNEWPCADSAHKYYCTEHGHCNCNETREEQTEKANVAAIQRVRDLCARTIAEIYQADDPESFECGYLTACVDIHRALDGEQA